MVKTAIRHLRSASPFPCTPQLRNCCDPPSACFLSQVSRLVLLFVSYLNSGAYTVPHFSTWLLRKLRRVGTPHQFLRLQDAGEKAQPKGNGEMVKW
ncbi:MAG: hypothetical protein WCL03_14385 [Bacteroidota bacterium]